MVQCKFLYLFIICFYGFSQTQEQKGIELFNKKKYQEAQDIFQLLLKENSENIVAIEYLGDIAGHQKNWDEAIKNYKNLTIKFPKNANYHYKLGGAMGLKAKSISKLKALGMIEKIKNTFEKAAQLDENHVETRWALVYLYLELPAIIGGSELKAQKSANELLKISPVDGFLAKGHIDEYFKRYEKAAIQYQKAHEIGCSKTTYTKLFYIISEKLKDKERAKQIKKHNL
jgi:tetratricopeptide (TPR) repeat protein